MNTIAIRASKISDLRTVRELFFRCVPPDKWPRSIMYSPAFYYLYYIILLLINRTKIYCAFDNKNIVGFCIARKKDGFWSLPGLYIDLDYRGKKIGEKILKHTISRHAPCKFYVEVNNFAVLNLHLKLGAKIIGTRFYLLIEKKRLSELFMFVSSRKNRRRSPISIFPVNRVTLGVRCKEFTADVVNKILPLSMLLPLTKYVAIYIEDYSPPPELKKFGLEEEHILLNKGDTI